MTQLSPAVIPDVQSRPDVRGIALDLVGVRDIRFPITVLDRASAQQRTVATIDMAVSLPHHFKGTHMSRFIEVLSEHGSVIHMENIETILRHLQKRLHSQQAHVSFEFPYFIEKSAPVTGALGLMDYTVKFTAAAGMSAHGICRFNLRQVRPDVQVYVTPVNIDPRRPDLPISHPSTYSIYLAKLIGPYSTLGLAEDTWALNEEVLDDPAFLQQCYDNHNDRERMFFVALAYAPVSGPDQAGAAFFDPRYGQ